MHKVSVSSFRLNRQVTSEMETKYSTGIIRELSVGEVRLAKGGVAQ